ncbi:MAG TPA: hypothetical protein VHB73_00835 [Alphaproteobacteria bacterium]|nr:hypothetical protein [Alphaproteobacteria bacterium]
MILLFELALGIAIGFIILVFLAAVLQVVFWIMFGLLIFAALGYLIIKFPIEILVAVLVMEVMALLVILVFKGLIGMGRSARLALFDGKRPPR